VIDVFVRDREAGVTQRVSVDDAGGQANGFSEDPAISDDGRVVAFTSSASNLIPFDTNAVFDVFAHDRRSGTTERVSVDSAGGQADSFSGYFTTARAAISEDGRFVAYASDATDLVPGDTNGAFDVFLRDRGSLPTSKDQCKNGGWKTYGVFKNQGDCVSFAPRQG
jgi:hypothetical protein